MGKLDPPNTCNIHYQARKKSKKYPGWYHSEKYPEQYMQKYERFLANYWDCHFWLFPAQYL